MLIRVRFESLDGKDHDLEIAYDPQLYNDGSDDVGWTRGNALLAHDRKVAQRARRAALADPHELGLQGPRRRTCSSTPTTRSGPATSSSRRTRALTGRGDRRDMTVALGFAPRATPALETAQASIVRGFDAISAAYAKGWTDYRASLLPIPAAAVPVAAAYDTSLFVLKAHEDKENRGRVRRLAVDAVGLGRAPDRRGQPALGPVPPGLAARPLPGRHRAPRGGRHGRPPTARSTSCSTNSSSTTARSRRTPRSTGGRSGRGCRWTRSGCRSCSPGSSAARAAPTGRHVRRAADLIVDKGPVSEQERWENQEGYSPATIAAQIAGLICAADIARKNGSAARAARYERTADSWARNVERWTATSNGPYSPKPYYLRLTKDRKPEPRHDLQRSATPGRRSSTSAGSSTSASSSWSGSASSASTTPRS